MGEANGPMEIREGKIMKILIEDEFTDRARSLLKAGFHMCVVAVATIR